MRKLAKAIAAALLASVGMVLANACEDRSLPTAPVTAPSTVESQEAPAARMQVVPAGRHRPGTTSRTTPGTTPPTALPTTTPAFGVPTSTPVPPTATPAGPTATPVPPTPSRTPTPGAATLIRLRAVRWAWQWVAGPPGYVSGAPSINLKSGRVYSLHVFNGDIDDPAYAPHWFSGILEFAVSGSQLPIGGADYVVTFTAPTVSVSTTYGFSCMEFGCGPVVRHEGMLGTIIVDP